MKKRMSALMAFVIALSLCGCATVEREPTLSETEGMPSTQIQDIQEEDSNEEPTVPETTEQQLVSPTLSETEGMPSMQIQDIQEENSNEEPTVPETTEQQLVLSTQEQQERAEYPPEGEYDTIECRYGQYFLCKKSGSGFSDNSDYYGIYDAELGTWSMAFRELETYDVPSLNFESHGDGMFSYLYSANSGTVTFLSADLGGTFKTREKVYSREHIYFDDGKALVLLSKDSMNKNGTLTPDNELVWMDTYGQMENVTIPGFSSDTYIYWNDFQLGRTSEAYARMFYTYVNKNRTYYIFVYYYDTNECVIIDEQEYASRVNNSGSYAYMTNGVLRVCNILGEDGKKYYAEFDREGNLVTPATKMD